VDQAVHVAGPGEAAANWVAARQHAVLHRDQAERAGVGRTAREGRCRRGSWRRLYPRVFAIGTQPLAERGRVLAATLDAGPFAVATAQTAAHAYALVARPSQVIHLAMVGRRNAAPRRGVRLHRPRDLTWNDVRFEKGIPITSPIETLLALAGLLGADELEAVCALTVRRGLTSRSALRDAIDASGPRPGLPALRAAARTLALTRSGNERRLLALIRRAELPHPQTNVTVAGKELDLYWPDARYGVEVDAFSTHGSIASFEDDRKVDADLDAADVRITRFTDRRIRGHPEAVIAKLAAILALRLGGLPAPRRR